VPDAVGGGPAVRTRLPAVTGSMPAPFSVSVVEQPDRVAIAVAGELDLATAPALEEALLPRLAAGADVVLDLTALEFMDSTGVRVIVSAHRAAQEHGGCFALVRTAPGSAVARILEISGLDGVLEIVDAP
jgi:anti-sigma B factor antagonist